MAGPALFVEWGSFFLALISGKICIWAKKEVYQSRPNVLFPWRCHLQGSWICTFVSSQAGSNLISLDHTANSPLDKHPHAIPGACLFCLAAFRLSYCQSMGHAEMKEMKLHTGFYVLLLRSCSLPEMLGFSAKYLSYPLRTVCSSPRRMSQRKPCKWFPVFNKAGVTI